MTDPRSIPQWCKACARHVARECQESNCPVVRAEISKSYLIQWPLPGGIPFPH